MTPFVPATEADSVALRDLEMAASTAALGHVFDPDRFPYPADDVLARWHLVLTDPGATTLLARDDAGRAAALVTYDAGSLRHLAVHPDHWGAGLARAAIELAVAGFARHGAVSPELWCLEDNHRARGLYEHLGWTVTEERQEAVWPPHPTEVRYVLLGGAHGRPAGPA